MLQVVACNSFELSVLPRRVRPLVDTCGIQVRARTTESSTSRPAWARCSWLGSRDSM